MAEEFSDEREAIKNPSTIESAAIVFPNPDHLQYSADKAVAEKLAEGNSAVIAAIDGVGSGDEDSEKAAELMQRQLISLRSSVISPPSVNEGLALLKKSIIQASTEIKNLQERSKNRDADTTVSAGIVCNSKDGKSKIMAIANVGDSRIYKYSPKKAELTQLTRDQSLVQDLVDSGRLDKREAFYHPLRHIINISVGRLKSPTEIGFCVTEARKGDIFLAVTDGVTDNLTPQELPKILKNEFRKSYDRSKKGADLEKFSKQIAEKSRGVMLSDYEYAKKDDITVAVLCIPR